MVTFQEKLIDDILDEIGKNEIYPPKLQIICSELYKTRGNANVITEQLYNFLGRSQGILDQYFYRVLERDLKGRRQLAQNILETLITPDRQRGALTRSDILRELKTRKVNTDGLDAVLEQLVDSRLLRTREYDALYYELMHDFLIKIVRLGEKTAARKVAQDLIKQRLILYKSHQLPLTREELSFVVPQINWLNLTRDEKALIRVSQWKLFSKSMINLLLHFTGVVLAIII